MEYDPLQKPQPRVEDLQTEAGVRTAQTKAAAAPADSSSGGTEDANAHRLLSMPQEHYSSDAAESVAAVMPPSEVRPILHGTFRKPQLVGKGNLPPSKTPPPLTADYTPLFTVHMQIGLEIVAHIIMRSGQQQTYPHSSRLLG
jgi:hypothetical protein